MTRVEMLYKIAIENFRPTNTTHNLALILVETIRTYK